MSTSEASVILERIEHLREEMAEVKALAAATNGRVRRLELWQARLEGVKWAVGRLPVVVACLAGVASIVALVASLT